MTGGDAWLAKSLRMFAQQPALSRKTRNLANNYLMDWKGPIDPVRWQGQQTVCVCVVVCKLRAGERDFIVQGCVCLWANIWLSACHLFPCWAERWSHAYSSRQLENKTLWWLWIWRLDYSCKEPLVSHYCESQNISTPLQERGEVIKVNTSTQKYHKPNCLHDTEYIFMSKSSHGM